MARRTGIQQIADEAGVSAATVSLALRDMGRMSEDTRSRIKEIADELDYQPNVAARSLISGHSRLIAISMPGPGDNPEVVGSVQYFFRILGAAAAKALDLGYGLLVTGPTIGAEQPAVDGAIVVDPGVDDPVVAACDRAGLPVVTIGRRLPGSVPPPENVLLVDNDFVAATSMMLDHLRKRGCSSIALLATEPIDSFQQDSIDTYEDWCGRVGQESRVVVAASPAPDGARRASDLLFDRGDPPDAVYATIDTLARAVIDRAARDGIEVPAELKVATCSDGELTRSSTPELTTMDERPLELAEAAVQMLVAVIEDRVTSGDSVEIETELLVRGSTS